MTYEEALQYIHGTLKFGSKLGLKNITNLLYFMGNPHKKLKYIHVGGTNGKGSVTSMITSILKQQGYKVGMYTSPYIEEFTERIQINGRHIEEKQLARITQWIQGIIQKMTAQGYAHPTEFEVVTAIAFQYYCEQACDFVVLEVGLGGRFDATNVIDSPLVSVITSIGMDHMAFLGDTIAQIAFEKSGIIKPDNIVVVCPDQHPDAVQVLRRIAQERNARIVIGDTDAIDITSDTLRGIAFSYQSNQYQIGLVGAHQVLNAVTAISAVEVLKKYYDIPISRENMRIGLETVRWPGRLEILSKDPLFIVDGAHNMPAVTALKKSLIKYLNINEDSVPPWLSAASPSTECRTPENKISFVIGMMEDKEYEKCIRILAPIADCMIATAPLDKRALPARKLGEVMAKYCDNVLIEEDIEQAVRLGMERVKKGACADRHILCCCGSLHLIGVVRKLFRQNL